MAWMIVQKFDRRDGATRESLGEAAFRLCKAVRESGHVTSSRFYWVDTDEVAIVQETEDIAAYWGGGSVDVTAAVFALGDVARRTSFEQWVDARSGMVLHTLAGR